MSKSLLLLLEQYDDCRFAARAVGGGDRLCVEGFLFHSPKVRGDFRDIFSEKLRGDHGTPASVIHSVAKAEAPVLFVPESGWPPKEGIDEWTRRLEARLSLNARELAAVALCADTGMPYTGGGPLVLAVLPFRDIDLAREFAKSVHAGEPRVQTEPLATLAYLAALHTEGKTGTTAAVAVSSDSTLLTLVHEGSLVGAEALDAGFNKIFAAIQAQLNLKFIGSAAKLLYDGIYDFSEAAKTVLTEYCEELRSCIDNLAAVAQVHPRQLLLTRIPPTARWIEAEIAEQLELSLLATETLPKPGFESNAHKLENTHGLLPLWHFARSVGNTPFSQVDWTQAGSLADVLKGLPVCEAPTPVVSQPEEPAAAESAAEEPAAEKPAAEKPAAEEPAAEEPVVGVPTAPETTPPTPESLPGERPDPGAGDTAEVTTPAASTPTKETESAAPTEPSAPADAVQTPPEPRETTEAEQSAEPPPEEEDADRKKPVLLIIGGTLAALLVLGVIAFFQFSDWFEEKLSIAVSPPTAEQAPTPEATAPEPAPRPEQEATPEPERQPHGTLSLTTVPAGATVIIAGENVGTTPLRLTDLKSGGHTVTLESEGYESVTLEAHVTAGQTTSHEVVELRALAGSLVVQSEPVGATVRLNGDERGTTPLHIDSVAVGAHEITVELEGYETKTFEAAVADREITAFNGIVLRPISGSLAVRSSPEGITFRLVPAEGSGLEEIADTTPADIAELTPGGYRVVFEREGWPNFTRPASIRHNEQTEVLMEYPEARLTFETEPPGAEVWSREDLLGTTPLFLEGLRPQRLRGVVRHDGYLPEEFTADLEPNGDHTYSFELVSAERIFSPEQVDVLPSPRENPLPETSIIIMRPETVTVRFIVDRDGRPNDITIHSSTNNRLNNLVLETVNNWSFAPAILRETPVRVRVVAPIIFNPPERTGGN